MYKKIIILFTIIFITSQTVTLWANSETDIKLFINGEQSKVDLQIINDTSYVPLRAVSEMLGADVQWDNDNREILIVEKEAAAPEMLPAGSYKAGNFIFNDVTVKKTTVDFIDYWEVTTTVKNNGAKNIIGAIYSVIFTNKSGKRLGVAHGSINELKIGTTKTIKLFSMDNLTGYESMEFQVDTIAY